MRWLMAVLATVFDPCTYGLHDWTMPGGWCEDCGECDLFFGRAGHRH